MNTQQIQIILAVAESGSISKAARRLFLSQPTVSSSIKATEAEIGAEIFKRTNHGITITEKGQEILRHARIIAKESEAMTLIGQSVLARRFHLIAPSSHTIEAAFLRLCQHYQTAERLDFSIRTESLHEKPDILYQGKADMAIFYNSPETAKTLPRQMEQKGLSYHFLKHFPILLTVQKDHPLATGPLDASRLNQYPCIIYRNLDAAGDFLPQEFYHSLDSRRIVLVESRELRLSLAASGIGYLTGIPHDPEQLKKHGLVSRPLFGLKSELGYLLPKNRDHSEPIQLFISYLKEELSRLEVEYPSL